MMNDSHTIVSDNLSIAWGKAFFAVYHAGEIAPLIVVIDNLHNQDPPEVPSIRQALDAELQDTKRGLSCESVANTIFPRSLWNPAADRAELYQRYRDIFPRLRRHRGNTYRLYFQRLISYGSDSRMKNGVNQLEHIITTWNSGNHRRTALQAVVFDPQRDHTHQRQRGFPCLQHICLAPNGPNGQNGLTLTGFYATQYMFQRAYGNYLGLCRLGLFMSHQMQLKLRRVVCIATPAKRDTSKRKRANLANLVEATIAPSHDDQPPQILNI